MKRRLITFIMLIVLMITSTVIGAFLTSMNEIEDVFEVGFVDVDLVVYFDDGNQTKTTNLEPQIDSGHVKKGIYLINITDQSNIQFIENLRIKFLIKSNVDTYFRFKMYESLVIKTTNTAGVITEYAIRAEFDYYTNTNFYKHTDGYVYYKPAVQRNVDETDFELFYIASYFPDQQFSVAPIGQELQVGFSVEAVQAIGGPQMNWQLTTPPWGGTWV